jgi:hypothetical protein
MMMTMTKQLAVLLLVALYPVCPVSGDMVLNPYDNTPTLEFRNDSELDVEVEVSGSGDYLVKLVKASNTQQAIAPDWSFEHEEEGEQNYSHAFVPGGTPPHFPIGEAVVGLGRHENGGYVLQDDALIIFYEIE